MERRGVIYKKGAKNCAGGDKDIMGQGDDEFQH